MKNQQNQKYFEIIKIEEHLARMTKGKREKTSNLNYVLKLGINLGMLLMT